MDVGGVVQGTRLGCVVGRQDGGVVHVDIGTINVVTLDDTLDCTQGNTG